MPSLAHDVRCSLEPGTPHNARDSLSFAAPLTHPPMEGWPTSSDAYALERKIGRGAFSTVWKAACATRETHVAIKVMDLEGINSSIEDITQEVLTMRLSNHPNVLPLYCSFVSGDELWLVTQLMDKGSCLRVMNIAKNQGFGAGMSEAALAYILGQTLQGLQYLHTNGQIHRDIKAGNILLDSNGAVKLADFGVAGWMVRASGQRANVHTFVGTPCWMAPEVMEQVDGYNEKADIWSLGITALELAKGYAPYAHYPPMKVLIMTIEQEPPSLKNYPDDKQCNGQSFSRSFEDFVRKCLHKDPMRRADSEQLLSHKFLKNRTPAALVEELLSRIDSVGDGEDQETARPEGTKPVIVDMGEEADESASGDKPRVRIQNAPTGTTWVFDDGGSQVVHKKGNSQVGGESNADFLDEFEEKIAEEKTHDRAGSSVITPQSNQEFMDDFADEFEADV